MKRKIYFLCGICLCMAVIPSCQEKGKETFYQKMGFKLIPHDYCGSCMRKVFINKSRVVELKKLEFGGILNE